MSRKVDLRRRAYRWTFAIVAMVLAAVISGSFLRADVPQVATGSWMDSGPFGDALSGSASAILADGKVVVAGGQLPDGGLTGAVVVYDPALGEWKSAGTLIEPRTGLSAAALADGRVIFAGGRTAAGVTTSVELFDLQAGSSQAAGDMMLRRADAAAATLPDGRVLIAGGTDGAGPLAAAELFDPMTGTSQFAASLAVARTGLSATTLLDGHVLVAGGNDGHNDLAMAEIYDPELGIFWETESMNTARSRHVAMRLPGSNTVLVAGGMSNGVALKSAEQYAHWGQLWLAYEPLMSVARVGAIAAPTSRPGVVLIGGGGDPRGEYYGYATVATDKDDYHPFEPVTISGSGWQPGEIVHLRVSEDSDSHYDWELEALADEAGNITNQEFYPREDDTFHHVGMRFYLSAVGIASQAQTTFTDAENYQAAFDKPSLTITATAGPGLNANKCYRFQFIDPSNTIVATSASALGNVTSITRTLTLTTPYQAGTWQVRPQVANNGCDKPFSDENSIPVAVTANQTPSTTTVTVANATYDGLTHGGIASVTGSGGLNQPLAVTYTGVNGTTYGPSSVAPTNAGDYAATATFAGNANYSSSTDTKNFSIAKAASTTVVTITGGPFTYTGSAIAPATVTVTGAGNLNLTPTATYADNVNAGTATASYTFAGDANHTGSSDSKNFSIGKATSTTVVTISGAPFTYTGSAITPATVAVTGAGNLSLTPTANYANNVNAGTATASYTFAGDANHLGSSDSKTFVIDKAASTTVVTITGAPFTYTGSAIAPATVAVTGAGGLNIAPTANYADNVNAGTATASYIFAGDANHLGSSDSKTFTIDKAASQTVVTIAGGPFTYTGSAITPATVAVTGVGGLNLTPTANYADNVNAGTATASYNYAGDGNHLGSSDSQTFTIGKATSTTMVTITGAPFIYTGSAITPATVAVTGVGGLNLTPTANYADNVNAGTATASYNYAGDANHEPSSDSKTFTIDKAASTTVVTIAGGPFTYTGSAITPATVAVTGVGGLNLTPTASYANNVNAGTATASYTFEGDANHTGSNDSKTFDIAKAASQTMVTINGGPFTYTGSAITPATVAVTGAGGLNLAPTAEYLNNVNAGTATASYTFEGDANHTGSNDSKTFDIAKAASQTMVTINGGPFTYTGSAITPATVAVTGAGGLNLAPTAEYLNNVNAGTATASYTFAGDANHLGSSDSKTFDIDKAASATVVTINGGPFTYTGSAITPATVAVTGAGGLNLTPAADYANNVNAGTATASYTFAGDANHLGSSDSKTFDIDKAASATVVTITGGPFTYTGAAITPATVAVTGAGGLNLAPMASYANNVDAGTATASYTYAGDANHKPSSDSKTFDIDRAASTTVVTINGGPFTYTGSAITPATVAVTGAGGLNLTPTASYANNVDAGTATASYNYAGDANHEASSDSKEFVIGKATSTTVVTINGGPFTYTGSAVTPATVAVTGANLNLTPTANYANNVNAGTATASYSFAGDANHTGSSDSKTFDIGKAASTVTVTFEAAPYTYRGTAFTATAKVTGAGNLDQQLSVSYTGDCTNVTATGCSASASFAGDANHTGASNSASISITKATASIVLSGMSHTYDGTPKAATVSTLPAGLTIVTVTYAGSTTAPTNAGTYAVTASLENQNYQGSATGTLNIDQATPTVSVTWTGGPFTGSAFYAGGTVTGVGSPAEALGKPVYAYYSGSTATGTPLAGAPVNVGTYTVRASYTGSQNYKTGFADATITIGAWSLKGFYEPVGETNSIRSAPGVVPTVSTTTVWNSIKGGQTVPLKFNIYRSVGGAQVTTVADAFNGAGFSAYQLPSCSGGAIDDEIALSDLSTGGTDLRWDGTQFIQNWKTPKVSGADLCYRAVVTAKDGSTITAFFKVKK